MEATLRQLPFARDWISRDLFDELSHAPSNRSQARDTRTPQHEGFDTPSGPSTPRALQSQQYRQNPNNEVDELRVVKQRMRDLENQAAQARASWEIERRDLMRQISHYRVVLERYCIPVDDSGNGCSMEEDQYFPAFEPSAPSQWDPTGEKRDGDEDVIMQEPHLRGSFSTESSSEGCSFAKDEGNTLNDEPCVLAKETEPPARLPEDTSRDDLKAREQTVERDSHLDMGGTPVSRRSSTRSKKSWADFDDEDDDDKASREKDDDVWTTESIAKVARKRFELRRRGKKWDVKIAMGKLKPRFTEKGMERWCQWLHGRLAGFQKEHGSAALRQCHAEVDFSHNHMNNRMLWLLLETLSQHEVHIPVLKLFSNNISQGGVLAICEFIRQSERFEALQELHLSHNEIDDESALELLRTLKSTTARCPPRGTAGRSRDSARLPLWLRLSHNRIEDTTRVFQTAEDEGIIVCMARNRNVCGTTKCARKDYPIAHLYDFETQEKPREN